MDRGFVTAKRKAQTEEERGKEFILQNRFWWGRTQGTGIDKRTLYSVEGKNGRAYSASPHLHDVSGGIECRRRRSSRSSKRDPMTDRDKHRGRGEYNYLS